MMTTVLQPLFRFLEERGPTLRTTWARVHGPIRSVLTVVMRREPLLDVLARRDIGDAPIDHLSLLLLGHGKKNL